MATTWYLNASTGSDTTGDGSSGNPWLTVGKAHAEAADGDTVILQDSVATYTFADFAFTKGLTLQGQQDDASGAVLDGASAARMWQFTQPFVYIIKNITSQNILGADPYAFYLGTANTEINFSFINCVFDNVAGYNAATYGMIGAHAIGVYGSFAFTNCLVKNQPHQGNVFRLHESGGVLSATMTGCTINYKLGGYAPTSVIWRYPTPLVAKNNIVSNYTGSTIYWQTDYSVTTATYCDFYNITSSPSGTGVITSDPLFIDGPNDDYRLRPTSPCIDTGVLV